MAATADSAALPEDTAEMSERSSFLTRLALPVDGPEIAEIYLRAVRQAMPWLRLAHDDGEVRAWFSAEVPLRHEVWVAEADGSVSAFMSLSLDRSWVDHLYVDPELQGCGHGSALIALAQSLSSGTLQLWAFQRNLAARDFYEHRGFGAVEFGDGSTNQEGEPDVLYLWKRAK
jgi:GNAT superfamily N-acetyltransferase